MVICRSVAIYLAADSTNSSGETGRIEELVLDALLTVFALCIYVSTGSAIGILVVDLRLCNLDRLGADLTGIGGSTVGLTRCIG